MSRLPRNLYIGLVALFLLAPLLVIAAISLNQTQFLRFPPQGLSLRWYAEIFTNEAWFNALLNTLMIALGSALLALSVAVPIAYALWRYRLFYARILYGLGLMPFVLPPVIMALGFLLFYTSFGLHGQHLNVIIAHGVFLVALPLVTVSLGLESIDRELLEAARTLGADERTVFRTVVVPNALPYAVCGFAFAFVLSLNEYIIAFMTVGFVMETLPIRIFNALRYGYTPVMASVAVLFIAVSVLVFGLIGRFDDLPKLLGAWSAKE